MITTYLLAAGINVPAIKITPKPIPGLVGPLENVAGMMAWGGYALCFLSILAGAVMFCGTVFVGWHVSKKVAGWTVIAMAGAFVIGSVGAIMAALGIFRV